MFGTIKRRRADILYSQYLRKLRNYTCEKCGARHEHNSRNFGVSHYWGRSAESTRFDDENCDVFCNIPCHQYFETHRTEYEQWKKKRLGEKAYKLLDFRAHQLVKRDDEIQIIIIKNLMKKLDAEREQKSNLIKNEKTIKTMGISNMAG